MGSVCIDRIGELVTNDPGGTDRPAEDVTDDAHRLGIRRDTAVVVDDGRIAWIGRAGEAGPTDERIDVEGCAVLPAFVDSHSHLIFGGDRTAEFDARMRGERYAAGGIRTTVAATRAADDATLLANATHLLREMRRQGTGTVEIKSGYGLSVHDEARSLTIAGRLTDETTYLGAHVPGPEFADDVDGYVALVTGAMLDACAPLARWIDVFVEQGAFGADAARTILTAGRARGLGLKVHANQLRPGPGVQVACEMGAASADHCTHLSEADVAALADSGTVATLVPGADFSTRSPVYPDGRRLVDAGATVALATDCNPGTSFTTSMPFCIALAVRECGLSPAEAVWAATAGGAAALRRDDVGRIAVGLPAALTVLDAPSHVHLAYRPGVPLTRPLLAPRPDQAVGASDHSG
ncbi:MAG: imidazolonepropionase [Nitriliruptoraceae bacterium]|nr:imidazolonepropionase [Nitriliruptoraceae bacterium]